MYGFIPWRIDDVEKFLTDPYGQNDKYNYLYCFIGRSRDILLPYVSLEYGFLGTFFEKFMDGYSVMAVNFGGYPPICMALFLGELMTWKNF